MKILLDENTDVRFKKVFPPALDAVTVKDMGWSGIKNGKLIELIKANGFHFGLWLTRSFLTGRISKTFLSLSSFWMFLETPWNAFKNCFRKFYLF